jgi:hypothetical protein
MVTGRVGQSCAVAGDSIVKSSTAAMIERNAINCRIGFS